MDVVEVNLFHQLLNISQKSQVMKMFRIYAILFVTHVFRIYGS